MKFKILSIGVVAIAGFAYFAIPSSASRSSSPAFVEAADYRVIHAAIYLKGQFAFREQVRLSSEVMGRVKAIFVAEGQTVAAGQPLIQIDDANVVDAIEQARSAVKRAELEVRRAEVASDTSRRNLERKKALFDQKMSSGQDLDTAESQNRSDLLAKESAQFAFKQSQAALAQVERQRNKLLITSPVSGVVVGVQIRTGETAISGTLNVPGSELMTIADPHSLVVNTQLPESLVGKVKVGQKAIIQRRQPGANVIEGKITSLGKRFLGEDSEVNPGTKKGLAVTIAFEPAGVDAGIMAGMGCEISLIEGGDVPVLAVPVGALRYDLKKSELGYVKGEAREYYVYVVEGTRIARRIVIPGTADQDWQEIKRGLRKGERVVAGPSNLLAAAKDGDQLPSAHR